MGGDGTGAVLPERWSVGLEERPCRDKVDNEKQFSPEIKNSLLKKQVHSLELSKQVWVEWCRIDFLGGGMLLLIPFLLLHLMFTRILYYTNKNYLHKYDSNTHARSIEYEIYSPT